MLVRSRIETPSCKDGVDCRQCTCNTSSNAGGHDPRDGVCTKCGQTGV